MSTTSSKSSVYGSSKQVSFKPWFLTCVEGDVFGWKEGARLKLKNGQSAGCVKAISVLSTNDKTVTVSVNVVVLQFRNNSRKQKRRPYFSDLARA